MDTSALVKLVVLEDESEPLKSFLRERPEDGLFSAALARTELIRAVGANGAQAIADARNLLNSLDTVVLTRQLLGDAGTLERRACAASTRYTWLPHSEPAMRCAQLLRMTPERFQLQRISEWSPHRRARRHNTCLGQYI
jgi:hypothetical protein